MSVCQFRLLTKQDHEVVGNTRSHVKTKSKITNFMKLIWIEGYNGKYGSSPQWIREISDDLFEFDQIGRWIDDRNWGKWYFMKEELKTNPQNQKSMNLTLILRRHWRLKMDEFFENVNRDFTEIKTKIT